MPSIIFEGEYIKVVSYSHEFRWRNEDGSQSGAGFGFSCDIGNPSEEMAATAKENYDKCISGEHDVIDFGIQKFEHGYWEPTILLCDCGQELPLDSSWANECQCGREYNSSGQLLAPRSQWGEETGESAADLSVNMDV